MNKFLNLAIACEISEMKLKIQKLEKALNKACECLESGYEVRCPEYIERMHWTPDNWKEYLLNEDD